MVSGIKMHLVRISCIEWNECDKPFIDSNQANVRLQLTLYDAAVKAAPELGMMHAFTFNLAKNSSRALKNITPGGASPFSLSV
jgi:hypothetical protein